MRIKSLMAFVFLLGGIFIPVSVFAQTTAFSYQGVLIQGGVPANGNFQMSFSLWTAQSGGTQVGATKGPMAVSVTNGGFTAVLDFGSSAFPGADRFLEINVGGTVLSPRPKLQSVPYAIRALTVSGPVTGADPVATLFVSNAQPGISNPSPANPPPAAVRGEATSTMNSNIGLLGVADGSTGIGVLGLTSGNGGPGGTNTTGVVGISTSTTGNTRGISGQISSPDGIAVSAESTNGGLLFQGTSSPNVQFLVDAAGNTRIGSGNLPANLFVTGTIQTTSLGTAGGAALCINPSSIISQCSSSVRYKNNIFSLGAGLDVVRRLRPITFRWKEGGQPDLGLIAEEVNSIEPLLVTHNAKGEIEGVKYDRLSAVFINAFKEQQAQIDRQQAEIDELKSKLSGFGAMKVFICSQNTHADFCKRK